MKIGLLYLDLHVPESGSLKHKRRYLQSLKKQIRNKYNVSVAEVGDHDLWQRINLAVAMVSLDAALIDKVFSGVVRLTDEQSGLELLSERREML